MLDNELDTMSTAMSTPTSGETSTDTPAPTSIPTSPDTPARPRRRRAASRPAGPPQAQAPTDGPGATGQSEVSPEGAVAPSPGAEDAPEAQPAATQAPTRARRTRRSAVAAPPPGADAADAIPASPPTDEALSAPAAVPASFGPPSVLFQAPAAPQVTAPVAVRIPAAAAPTLTAAAELAPEEPAASTAPTDDEDDDDDAGGESDGRRRRRRGGRRRKRRGDGDIEDTPGNETSAERGTGDPGPDPVDAPVAFDDEASESAAAGAAPALADDEDEADSRRRRRRRRRSTTSDVEPSPDDPPNTVVKVRAPRARGTAAAAGDDDSRSEVRALRGSTRLEAKKQRRREGRDQGRRRVPVITESEFLARRESVERVMVVRQAGDRTQIAVLEDGMLVEHYINRASSTSFVGNVYLGRVQNVLPGMEAAFVDIGKGRNGVLYAGEVNWDAAGLEGQPRRIESALKAGEPVLVQVTKDPMGSKGARLTSQISLPGRFLVYVPDGSMTGISRKLPDTERGRLKSILRGIVPEDAGVIVRTAAEGASEEELSSDVARLRAQAEDIAKKAANGSSAPALLYGEPDLTVRVVRDVFNEDFTSLLVSGDEAWDTVQAYVGHVAPDLVDRVSRWSGEQDVFASYRIDEQLTKALDRKVWLPSGGSLVIDRTEAMVVVDVNTGKFTGKGGNLEETVTKNNLEAAEEIVRQLRLRDLGGIIVIDFIDMVLESNRDLVLRRLLECLGRDRTKHQVAEVTSLGLVQMTRKRVGQGLLEAFSETCEHCNGRGVRVSMTPVPVAAAESSRAPVFPSPAGGRRRRGATGTPGGVPLPGPAIAGPFPGAPSDFAAEDESAADLLGPSAELSAEATAVQTAQAQAAAGVPPAVAATGEPESVGIFDRAQAPVGESMDVAAATAAGHPLGEQEETVPPTSRDPLSADDAAATAPAEPVRPRRRRATRTVTTPAPEGAPPATEGAAPAPPDGEASAG